MVKNDQSAAMQEAFPSLSRISNSRVVPRFSTGSEPLHCGRFMYVHLILRAEGLFVISVAGFSES